MEIYILEIAQIMIRKFVEKSRKLNSFGAGERPEKNEDRGIIAQIFDFFFGGKMEIYKGFEGIMGSQVVGEPGSPELREGERKFWKNWELF